MIRTVLAMVDASERAQKLAGVLEEIVVGYLRSEREEVRQ